MLESSPADGAVVGGSFHQIAMFFTGIDAERMPEVELIGPPGSEPVPQQVTRKGQQVVLAIDPISEAGDYRVTWSAWSADGDGEASGDFSFRYSPDAEPPAGLKLRAGSANRFDAFAIGLACVGAGLAAFLAHRFWLAWKDHKHDQQHRSLDSTDHDEDRGNSLDDDGDTHEDRRSDGDGHENSRSDGDESLDKQDGR